jgi:hypothetical protein
MTRNQTRNPHSRKPNILLPLALLASFVPFTAFAQETGIPTQTLLRVDSKDAATAPTIPTTSLLINNKPVQISSLVHVPPSGTQIAILIDAGLRRSSALQFNDLRKFITGLPAGTEVLLGYMENGRVQVEAPFSTDHAAAAAAIHIPNGIPGISASPYFCLSDFVKHWPGNDEAQAAGPASGAKARFALMITDGVDPYNGSTRITNQDSPYVQAAIDDSARAGVAVYSIYYGDAGIRGGSANFSGQSYLKQVADATGGDTFYQGFGEPVSFQPFLKQFTADISETYVATFDASPQNEGHERLVRLKVSSSIPKLKLRHADEIRPGNHEAMFTGPATAQNAIQ